MNKDERQAAMKSLMEEFFGGMSMDDKKEMCATMLGKMTEGLDMKEMMPKMMMGMMSGNGGQSPCGMQEMMRTEQEHQSMQMPEMMLQMMMPHCIEMMLPAIAPERRGEVAAAILKSIVEKGPVGMSESQSGAFHRVLEDILTP